MSSCDNTILSKKWKSDGSSCCSWYSCMERAQVCAVEVVDVYQHQLFYTLNFEWQYLAAYIFPFTFDLYKSLLAPKGCVITYTVDDFTSSKNYLIFWKILNVVTFSRLIYCEILLLGKRLFTHLTDGLSAFIAVTIPYKLNINAVFTYMK